MHLYVHEFDNPKDASIREVKDLMFENSLKDYQMRIGKKQKSLKVETTKHGKPFFPKAKKIHFSISHSGRFWVCLFDKENVGVDIEDYSSRNMPVNRFMDISDRFYKPDEKDFVQGDTDSEDDEVLKKRFFKIWTAKESYMKYTGNGFTEGFKNFSVLDESLGLFFRSVPVDPETVLTFCSARDANLDELINL